LLYRYGDAVRRYLRKVLQDPDADDEVFQEFAFRLLNGDLRGANAEHGRFRDFVKGTLFHLIADYRKQQQRWPGPLPREDSALAVNPQGPGSESSFGESWCDHLLARAWAALAENEVGAGLSGGGNFDASSIDPNQLPVNGRGHVVYPHNFLQVNTIFNVAHDAGLYTAFSDKHPSYEIANGPSAKRRVQNGPGRISDPCRGGLYHAGDPQRAQVARQAWQGTTGRDLGIPAPDRLAEGRCHGV
jgi:hypothetical protein